VGSASSGRGEAIVGHGYTHNGLRVCCVLLLELALRKNPNGEPRILPHVFRIGIDWHAQTIKDLKLEKVALGELKKRHPERSMMDLCHAYAAGHAKVPGWDFNTGAKDTRLRTIIATNIAVFQGRPLQHIRHPSLPLALLFT